jgi:hypothetical protein
MSPSHSHDTGAKENKHNRPPSERDVANWIERIGILLHFLSVLNPVVVLFDLAHGLQRILLLDKCT